MHITDTSYQQLPDTTRVWIYQASQPFPAEQVAEVRAHIQAFAKKWVAHNQQLHAYGDLLHRRFVVLMVDESQAGASGCSIDASVHFLKELQAHYGVDLFDRMRFSYLDGQQVQTLAREDFAKAYAEGQINDHTLVFDPLVKDKGSFERAFTKRLSDSWHARMV